MSPKAGITGMKPVFSTWLRAYLPFAACSIGSAIAAANSAFRSCVSTLESPPAWIGRRRRFGGLPAGWLSPAAFGYFWARFGFTGAMENPGAPDALVGPVI